MPASSNITPTPSGPAPVATNSVPVGDQQSDRANLQRLEQEARALAQIDGCGQSSQCQVAPVGAKACGGPKVYLPYCIITTDTAALMRKLDELKNADMAFNQKYQVISDCSFVTPPSVGLSGGSCVVANSSPGIAPPR